MNWKKLIQEILDTGKTKAWVAREIDIKPPSLNEVMTKDTRTDMRWTNGGKLLSLHKRVVVNSHSKSTQ